jgi:hypothetical protein
LAPQAGAAAAARPEEDAIVFLEVKGKKKFKQGLEKEQTCKATSSSSC